jgi:ATP-dependent RNA helicase DDX55/SPB4
MTVPCVCRVQDIISEILGLIPKQRRTGLFSATQTREVKALARAGLRNPAIVTVRVQDADTSAVRRTPASLENYYVTCEADERLPQLVSFLHANKAQKHIVFFSTCAGVDFFNLALGALKCLPPGVPLLALHGRMVQTKREATYARFKAPGPAVLLCTDVAARGIDLPDIDWTVGVCV